MFKIPTYEDLEKGEKALSDDSKRKQIQQNLFQKRKLIILDDTRDLNSAQSSSSSKIQIDEINSEPEEILHNKKFKPNKNVPKASVPIENDDEDDLLNEFIIKNKDLIDDKNPPSTSSSNSTASAPSNEPKNRIIVINKPLIRTEPQQQSNSTAPIASSKISALVVNSRQKGNPMLKHLTNVPWVYSETLIPDYCMSRTSCAYYLSMKYHLLNPTYIHTCLRTLGRAYDLRVLLVIVDIKDPKHCIKEIEKICILSNLTMIMCWSNEEAAHYLETYKMYEFKSAEAIMEKSTNQQQSEYSSHIYNNKGTNEPNSNNDFVNNYTDFLCAIKSINKTDASTLRQTFGSIKNLSNASKEELNLVPGFGPLKVNKFHDIFHTPFLLNAKK
jgi:DNA excision repair protein ERCC-1